MGQETETRPEELLAAKEELEKGLALSVREEDAGELIRVLYRLGTVCLKAGKTAEGREYLEMGHADAGREAYRGMRAVRFWDAWTLRRLGSLRDAEKDPEGARQLYGDALALLLELADTGTSGGSAAAVSGMPSGADVQEALRAVYNCLGDLELEEGDLSGAKEFYEKRLELSRAAARAGRLPQCGEGRPDDLLDLGRIEMDSGNAKQAAALFERGAAMQEGLCEADCFEGISAALHADLEEEKQNGRDLLGDLYDCAGLAYLAMFRPNDAVQWLEKGLIVRDMLYDFSSEISVRKRIDSFLHLGKAALQMDQWENAEEFFGQAYGMAGDLLRRSDSAEVRFVRAQCLDCFGDLELRRGRLELAAGRYREALLEWKHLAENTPAEEYYRAYSECAEELGVIRQKQGETHEAAALYLQSLEVRRHLAARTQLPEDDEKQAVLCERIAAVTEDAEKRRSFLQEALKIWGELAGHWPEREFYSEKAQALSKDPLLLEEIGTPVDIPAPYRIEKQRNIRRILTEAARACANRGVRRYTAPDIPPSKGQKAVVKFAVQVNWQDIVILEDYSLLRNLGRAVLYTETAMYSTWMGNGAALEYARVRDACVRGQDVIFTFYHGEEKAVRFDSAAENVAAVFHAVAAAREQD